MSVKETITGILATERIVTESSDLAQDLYDKGRFGVLADSRLQLSLIEALYLVEKKKLVLLDGRNKEIPYETFLKKIGRKDKSFWTKYVVFRDIRDRGYIIKTALKFGADFRVYDRGVKPGEDHAKWVVYPVHETQTLTWHEFSSKNRVAHSTRKRLLIGVVDEENDVTYYEIRWTRP